MNDNETTPPSGIKSSSTKQWDHALTALLIIIAMGLSIWVRMDWVKQAEKNPLSQWESQLLPTTHDSYLFASVLQQSTKSPADSVDIKNHPHVADSGAITILGYMLIFYLGFDVYDVIIYTPILCAGFLAIPIVLIGRLYGSLVWGACAATIAVVGSSYFNRTSAGYFDTDMFSLTIPATILFFLLKAYREKSLYSLYAGATGIYLFPFFYLSGPPIVGSIGLTYVGLCLLSWLIKRKRTSPKDVPFALASTFLVCLAIALCPWTIGNNWLLTPIKPIGGLVVLAASIWGIHHTINRAQSNQLMTMKVVAVLGLTLLILMPGPIKSIALRAMQYMPSISQNAASSSTSNAQEGLVYKNVMETIVEARKSNWDELMIRITGSTWACFLAILGFIGLVIAHREFIIALPFIGIGVFAHWGGHRFTIHAVPIAALAITFIPIGLFLLIKQIKKFQRIDIPEDTDEICWIKTWEDKNKFWNMSFLSSRIVLVALTLLVLYPNIILSKNRSKSLTTVLSSDEVALIDSIRNESRPGDYVHSWWDWGSAIWFHAERNVLTSPINQSFDTYIFAKMMTTDSPRLAAHLARSSAEYFHHGTPELPNGLAVDHLFANRSENPDEILSDLEDQLPVERTRDVYLFMPTKLLNFFPVLHMFSERDLRTGEVYPHPTLVPFSGLRRQGNIILGYVHQNHADPTYLIDLNQLTLSEYEKRKSPDQLKIEAQMGRGIRWNTPAITLQSKSGQFAHVRDCTFSQTHLNAKLLDGKPASVPLENIQWIIPSHLLKQVEQLDKGTKYEVDGAEAKPGLHFVFSESPPMAILTSSQAYNSQLFQMLVLGRHDSEYFELLDANPSGKVFKIKK